MLVFLENMIQFGFEFAHRNISRSGLTKGRLAHNGGRPKAAISNLILFPLNDALEILIAAISESNGFASQVAEFPCPAALEISLQSHFRVRNEAAKVSFLRRKAFITFDPSGRPYR